LRHCITDWGADFSPLKRPGTEHDGGVKRTEVRAPVESVFIRVHPW
jgi:hypothetical protein